MKADVISLITCHYNDGDTFSNRSQMLFRHLESLQKTITHLPVEVILVDNGCVAGDKSIIMDYFDSGLITHYIQNKDNMHWAYAWDQGYKLSAGNWLFFTCDDLEFYTGWLDETLRLVKEVNVHNGMKLFGSPFVDKYHRVNKRFEHFSNKEYRINSRAGSNALLINRRDYEDIGRFPFQLIGGSYWYDWAVKAGYACVVPAVDMAKDMGHNVGYDKKTPIEIKKTLLNGESISFLEDKDGVRV